MSYRRKDKKGEDLPFHHLNAYQPHDNASKEARFTKHWTFSSCRTVSSLKVLLVLLLFWICIIHYFERVAVSRSLMKCSWKSWEGYKENVSSHRVAFIADPQIVDDHYYERASPIMPYLDFFIRKLSDNYLHRNHRVLHKVLKPDSTIFLGDLFEGGLDWEKDKWLDEYLRFNKIFDKTPNRRTFYNLPGNHDIGFELINYETVKRFFTFFGKSNEVFEIGNHSFIFLDTISLSSSDEEIRKQPEEFLSKISDSLNPYFPRILLTHVPLYRDKDKLNCGPLRESKKLFPLQKGKQYQTVIDKHISEKVLRIVKPIMIFSGDDHDYCEIVHEYSSEGSISKAREITVKSASMTGGIQYPAIQLLSLYNPYDLKTDISQQTKTFETKMCFLPPPYKALKIYSFLYLLSIILLALSHMNSTYHACHNPKNPEGILGTSEWKGSTSFFAHKRTFQLPKEYFMRVLILTISVYMLFALYYIRT